MILLTNDDGIGAPSMIAMRNALSELDKCFIIAPHTQKSASAHAISLRHDVELSEFKYDNEFFGYQVKGTPADCVKLALCELLTDLPQVIVSGINLGPNTGVSVYYSGTVSAAREGTIAGIPSIAISLCSFTYTDFSYACTILKKITQRVIQQGLPEGVTLNINVPPLTEEEIKGIKITKQAHSRFVERYTKNGHNGESTLYSLSGELELVDEDPDNDEQVVKEGYVSVTPIQLDLTSFSSFKEVEALI